MPASVAEKPGGVVTVSALRFWSPSVRVRSSEKGLWAPAVLSAEAASKLGLNGRVGPGQGAPSGPGVDREELGRGLARRGSSPRA